MKLAIITSRYPSEENPYNHMFVHVRALYFLSQGVDLCIFVPSDYNSEYTFEGIKVVKGTSEFIINQLEFYSIFNIHLLNFFPKQLNGGLRIYKHLKKERKPIMLGIHGADIFKYPEYLFDFSFTPRGIAKFFYKNYWNYPHIKAFVKEINNWENSAVVFPSNWMKNYTEKHFGLTLKNPKIIANGIDNELFQFKNLFSNKHKIITIRPFESKYGVDQAIEIMKHLPDEFTLDIYGKGKEKKKYEKLIKINKLYHRIKIYERFIDRSEMNSLFHKYGIFFAFSKFDSQGVSMCEAMTSGLLTVTNDNTALPEFVINMQTGIVGNDLLEIADRIQKIIMDEKSYMNLTENARKFMLEIDWRKTGNHELDVLNSIK